MLPSWRLALSTLAGRPGRSVLLCGAVAAAAALVVAVSCATTSVQATMEKRLTDVLGSADARIIHLGNGRFSQSWLDTARQWPGVRDVSAQLLGSITLIRSDQRTDPETGQLLRVTPITVGVDFDAYQRFRHLDLRSGRSPQSSRDILIDPLTAETLQCAAGDTLAVQRFGPPVQLTVAGVYERLKLGALQRPEMIMDRTLLAELSGFSGQISRVLVQLDPDVESQAFCDEHAGQFPDTIALEPAEMARSGFDKRVDASRFGLIVSTVITFLSASFIIVTGLTTSVTERQREMAIIRCVGASRSQLFAGQMFIGAMYATIGALVGVPLGAGFAALLVWWFRELLPAGFVWSRAGVTAALAGALLAGLLGAVFPAWMASRATPLEAMTQQGRPPRRFAVIMCAIVALCCIALQLSLMLPDDRSTRFWTYFYIGLPALFVGYFLLATPVLMLLTRTIGRALCVLLRLPVDVVTGSIRRTRFRHGFTAGALMVGVAILVGDWSTTDAVVHGWLDKIKFADGFAYRFTGITPAEQQTIAALPFVKNTCRIGYLPLRVYSEQVFGVEGLAPPNVICVGFDPDVFFAMNAVDWIQGNPHDAIAALKTGKAVVVADRFLVARNIGVGDSITLGMGKTQHNYEIVGVVSSAGLDIATQIFGIRSQYSEYAISCVFMDFHTVEAQYDNRDAYIVQVDLSSDVTDEQATAAITNAVPGVIFRTGRSITELINQVAIAVYSVESTVAFAALLLACLGMGNVIAASIHGRRFEYGLLRAVGAHRSMLVRLIFCEVTILALAGASVGTLLGMHTSIVGTTFYRDMAGIRLPITFAAVPTIIGWIVTVGLSLAASSPGVRMLLRTPPSTLLAAGRND